MHTVHKTIITFRERIRVRFVMKYKCIRRATYLLHCSGFVKMGHGVVGVVALAVDVTPVTYASRVPVALETGAPIYGRLRQRAPGELLILREGISIRYRFSFSGIFHCIKWPRFQVHLCALVELIKCCCKYVMDFDVFILKAFGVK